MPLTIINDETETATITTAKGGTELMFQRLVSSVDPDLLSKFQIIPSRVRTIEDDKKRILWIHDLYSDPENQHLKDDESLDRFEKLVFVSHWQKTTFLQAFSNIPPSKCVVMKNAIDVSSRDIVKPDNGIVRLIYHTTPHRGLEILVPVFEELAKTDDKIHLDVYSSFRAYGWGHRDKPYEHLFERCRNHPQISYHGFQENQVVRQALDKANIFCYPSIWQETSCIAAIEAMSSKVAIVTSDLAALPETTAGLCTMYQYHENPNYHAGTFYTVLKDAIENYRVGRLTNMVNFAKAYADSTYNWETRKLEWEALLRNINHAENETQGPNN